MKNFIKCFLLMFTILILRGLNVYAESPELRSCAILPIIDLTDRVSSQEIYNDLEVELKKGQVCRYQSSSSVLEIFGKYRGDLPKYLESPEVLKTVADRLKVGLLFRVKVMMEADLLNLEISVVAANGVDVIFKEKTQMSNFDQTIILTSIKNWLELIDSTLPYEGRVSGVLGKQVTIILPQGKKNYVTQNFQIRTFTHKKTHPLLKTIVEWDSQLKATGKVQKFSVGQVLGVIDVYHSDNKVAVGDWVRFEEYNPPSDILDRAVMDDDKENFGKLGEFFLALNLGSHTTRTQSASGNNKWSGLIYGFSAEVEAWLTRNFFVLGEFSQRLGELKKTQGSPISSDTSVTAGVLKVAGGYKYLPMGFFYGPQVNLYAGYVNYSYKQDVEQNDGLGTNSITGYFIGIGGNIPLRPDLRLYSSIELVPFFGNFEDESNIYGSNKSLGSTVFNFGAQYYWKKTMRVFAAFNMQNQTGIFKGNQAELGYSENNFRLGGVIDF